MKQKSKSRHAKKNDSPKQKKQATKKIRKQNWLAKQIQK